MSALHLRGKPGDRVLRNAADVPVLAELRIGVWMPVMPCASWEDWRQLAREILDMEEPAAEAVPG